MRRILISAGAVILVASIVLVAWWLIAPRTLEDRFDTSHSDTREQTEQQPEEAPSHSLDDPTSPWVLVNHDNRLPAEYVPSDLRLPNVSLELRNAREHHQLRDEAARATEEMVAEAAEAGVTLELASGYRPYDLQAQIYQANGGDNGQTVSAPPGASEHQTGLAADFKGGDGTCRLQECFEDTEAGEWLAEHAFEYGFILRYPKGTLEITGYSYEPWHFRFVGTYLSEEIHEAGLTFEEYVEQQLR